MNSNLGQSSKVGNARACNGIDLVLRSPLHLGMEKNSQEQLHYRRKDLEKAKENPINMSGLLRAIHSDTGT
jgi:hypothetical protein